MSLTHNGMSHVKIQSTIYQSNHVTELYTKDLLLLYLQLHASFQDSRLSDANMVTKIGVVLRTQPHVL
jgi:hypothetical protein